MMMGGTISAEGDNVQATTTSSSASTSANVKQCSTNHNKDINKESEELRPLTSFEVYSGRHRPTILLALSDQLPSKQLQQSNTPHTLSNTHIHSSRTHSHVPLPPEHLEETPHSTMAEKVYSNDDYSSDGSKCIVLAPPNSPPLQLSTETHETIGHTCNPRQRIMEKMLHDNNNTNSCSILITDESITHNDVCKDKTTSQGEEVVKESTKTRNVTKEKIVELMHQSVDRITKKRKKVASHSNEEKSKKCENVNVLDSKNEMSDHKSKTNTRNIEESNNKEIYNVTNGSNTHTTRLLESPPPVPLHLSSSYQRSVIAAQDVLHTLNVNCSDCGCDGNSNKVRGRPQKESWVEEEVKEFYVEVKQKWQHEEPQKQTNTSITYKCCPNVQNGTSNNINNNNENTCSTLINACRYYPLIQRSVSPASQLNEYESLSLQRVYDELQQRHQVLRVCLTGGPCAGKSTLLAEIQSRIPDRTGFQVLCVPEAATLLVTGGMKWNDTIKVEQQLCLIRTQLSLEDQFYALALASHKPSIIISDRGTMDGRAFCSDADFDMILSSLGCTLEVLRDRYDMVLHMVTAAIGAESYYNLDNPARYEDIDGARSSDLKLRQMYVGHLNFRLLDNTGTFTEKIERGLQYVTEATGQVATHRTRYFYVLRSSIPTLPLPLPLPLSVPYASYHIHYTILANSSVNDIRLLVKRTATDGSTMFFFKSIRHITATHTSTGSRYELSNHSRQHVLQNDNMLQNGNIEAAQTDRNDDINNKEDGKSQGRVMESTDSSSSSSSSSSTSLSSEVYTSEECVESQDNQSQHNCTTSNTQRVERSQRISAKEYLCLLKHRDVQHEKVSMRAMHFILNGCSYEVMTLMRPSWARGKQTISVESASECNNDGNNNYPNSGNSSNPHSNPVLPDFIHIDREVPIEQHTTLFLISHKESGQLYASLVFAPNLAHNSPNDTLENNKNNNNKMNNTENDECNEEMEADTNEKSKDTDTAPMNTANGEITSENAKYDKCNNEVKDDVHCSSHVDLCGETEEKEDDSTKVAVDTTVKKLACRSLSTINVNNGNVQGRKSQLKKVTALQIQAGDLPTLVTVQENAMHSKKLNTHEKNNDNNSSVFNTQRTETSTMKMRKTVIKTDDCKENKVPSVNL